MYFLSSSHEESFNHLITVVFPHAKNDSEYLSMAYILSLPMIYGKCINDPMFHQFPFLWTVEYENTSYTDFGEDGEYTVTDFEVKKDAAGNEVESENYSYLSNGYKKMVNLAANLFNSSNDEFNLTDAFGTWDDNLLKVYFQAVKLRLGRRKVTGLDVDIC